MHSGGEEGSLSTEEPGCRPDGGAPHCLSLTSRSRLDPRSGSHSVPAAREASMSRLGQDGDSRMGTGTGAGAGPGPKMGPGGYGTSHMG